MRRQPQKGNPPSLPPEPRKGNGDPHLTLESQNIVHKKRKRGTPLPPPLTRDPGTGDGDPTFDTKMADCNAETWIKVIQGRDQNEKRGTWGLGPYLSLESQNVVHKKGGPPLD